MKSSPDKIARIFVFFKKILYSKVINSSNNFSCEHIVIVGVYLHIHNLSSEIFALCLAEHIGVAVAHKGVSLLMLKKYRQNLAYAGIHKLPVHLLCNSLSLMGTGGLKGVLTLIGHFICGSAGTAGIGENVHIGKSAALNEGKGVCLVLVGLPGEACN